MPSGRMIRSRAASRAERICGDDLVEDGHVGDER
jgi:hypothetical protein